LSRASGHSFCAIGITPYGAEKSSPVTTARTPGIDFAFSVPMRRITPCATGLLRMRPTSVSPNGRSAV
jgi:hypothetical protein